MVQDFQELKQIEAARRGDVAAFNTLVLQYQDQVYNAAYRIMGDAFSADDMAQEAFVTAYRKLDQFQGRNFQAWLVRIAINRCYDELRRDKRRPAEALDDGGIDEEADTRLVSNTPDPEAYTQRAELSSAIEHCFDQLPAEYRVVSLIADVEAYSYEE